MKNILFALMLSICMKVNAAQKLAVTVGDGTLQAGTTIGINISSGTILSLNSSTGTFKLINTSTVNATTFNVTNFNVASISLTTVATSSITWRGVGITPVVQTQTYTTSISSAITSGNFTNTNLVGTFTPRFNNSKLLIQVVGDFGQSGSTTVGYLTLARNGTNLASSTGGFSLTVAPNTYSAKVLFYDSPATTSATTYAVQLRTNGGGTAIFPITDGGSFTSTANMIIQEIAQ